jgi:hypothetical protein
MSRLALSDSPRHLARQALGPARARTRRSLAITASPTQRSIPRGPRYRQRRIPWQRLRTLIRPSQPVRQRSARQNQRCRRGGGLSFGLGCPRGRGRTILSTPSSAAARTAPDAWFQRWLPPLLVRHPGRADRVIGDEPAVGLLDLDLLAELGRLRGRALANGFGRGLKDAQDFSRTAPAASAPSAQSGRSSPRPW